MKLCRACHTEFEPNHKRVKHQIYCSTKCNANACYRRKKSLPEKLTNLTCEVCDKSFDQKRINNTSYCSWQCKRLAGARRHQGLPIKGPKQNAPWGKGYITSSGYKIISKNHPNARCRSPKTGKGQIMEHIWLMSQYLGRPLHKHERVHHKNGIRNDNRIENLELWSHDHPPGHRVSDKIKWAKEFLEEYGYKIINM